MLAYLAGVSIRTRSGERVMQTGARQSYDLTPVSIRTRSGERVMRLFSLDGVGEEQVSIRTRSGERVMRDEIKVTPLTPLFQSAPALVSG